MPRRVFSTAKRRRRTKTRARTSSSSTRIATTNDVPSNALVISVSLRTSSSPKNNAYAVEQSRQKPMGRFRNWSVATLNKKCEVVYDVRAEGTDATNATDASPTLLTRLQQPHELVLALTGRQVGKLYDPSVLDTPSDTLTDAACVALVTDIAYNKATARYVMRADPFALARTMHTPKARKRRLSSGQALVPLLYTYVSLFLESGARRDGRVVFVDDTRVELLVEDTSARKVWYTLTAAHAKHDKLDRPVVTVYALTRTPTDDSGGGYWTCDKRVQHDDTVDRLTYTLQTDRSDALRAHAAYLQHVSANGFTHLVSLAVPRRAHAKAAAAARKSSNATASSASDVHNEAVVVWSGDAPPTLECRATQPRVHTFPFSVTAQLDDDDANGARGVVFVGLQLQRDTYRPMLTTAHTDSDVSSDDRILRTRQNVLLPTTHDLLHTHPLGATRCTTAATDGNGGGNGGDAQADDGIVLTLTSPPTDPRHAARCVRALLDTQRRASLCRLERAIVLLDGVTRAELERKRPPDTLHIHVSRRDATTLTRVLCGQVRVTRAKPRTSSTGARRTRAAANTPPARHWGRIGRSYVYHHKDYTPAWAHTMHDHATASFFRPMVRVDVLRSRLPFPVCHVPVTASAATGTRMPLHDRKYFPYHTIRHYGESAPYDRWGTLDGALPTVEAKPAGVINHKVVLKNLGGSGERALFEIARCDNPSWFNVVAFPEEHTTDHVRALVSHFTTDVHEPSMHVLREGVHAVVCDARGRSYQMHYGKFPLHDPMRVEPLTHVNPSLRSAHHDIDNQRLDVYGFTPDVGARLSQLSHVLFGSTQQFYRAANDTHQSKPTRVERLVDGYTPNACQLNGIVTLPRFVGVPTVVRNVRCVIRVKGREHTVVEAIRDGRGDVHACCRVLTRALRKQTGQKTFAASVRRDRACVVLACTEPFVVVDAGTLRLFGVRETTNAQTHVESQPQRLHTMVPVPHDAAHLTRTAPTHHVRFAYETTATHTISSSSGDTAQQKQLTFAVHSDDRIDAPFERANTCKMQTRIGRDGYTRFTSFPTALRVLAVAWVVPLARWVVVRGDRTVWVVAADDLRTAGALKATRTPIGTLIGTVDNDIADVDVSAADDTNATGATVHVDAQTGVVHTASQSYRTTLSQLSPAPQQPPQQDTLTRDPLTGAWRVGGVQWTRATVPLCASRTVTHVYVLDSAWDVYAHPLMSTTKDIKDIKDIKWARVLSFATTYRHSVQDVHAPCALGVQQQRDGAKTVVVVGDTYGGLVAASASSTSTSHATTSRVSLPPPATLSAWYWQRTTRGVPAPALRVVIRGTQPVETLTHHDCAQVQLGTRIAQALRQWWGVGFSETIAVAYSFDAPLVLHSFYPLTTHLRKYVMGYARTTPSEALLTAVSQLSARTHHTDNDAVDVDARALATRYYGGRQSLDALPVDDALGVHKACAAHVERVRAWLHGSNHDETPSPSPKPKQPHTKPHAAAVRARFYYKVQRLLRTPDGVAYLQDTYAQSARFRKQLVGCCGFCANKFLYKVKTLRIDGCPYATKTWSDAWRDRFTDIGKGDVYHVCRQCGDQVCRQDGGLRTEYNASGGAMSSTHAEHDLDANTSTEEVRREADAEAEAVVEQLQQQCTAHTHLLLRAIDEYLDTEKVLLHRDTLMQLPLTTQAHAFLLKRKLRHVSLATTHTLYDLVHHPKRGRDDIKPVLLVFQSVVRALKRVLARAPQPAATATVQPMEASFVPTLAAIAPQLRLAGIAPRTYFRPRMKVLWSRAHNTPQWNAVYDALVVDDTAATASTVTAIDWHARQDTSELYAQNDVYICIARDVSDEVHGYTSLPDVLGMPRDATQTWTTNAVAPRTRFAIALPTRGLPLLLGRTLPVLPARRDNQKNSVVLSRTSDARVQPRTVTDVQRRQHIVEALVHPTSSTLTMQGSASFPHVLQMFLRPPAGGKPQPPPSAKTRRAPHTIPLDHAVLQLQSLVGIVPNTDLRRSVHPAALRGARTRPPDWVTHWLQLDTSKRNEQVVKLVDGVRCVLGDAVVKHNGRRLMAAVLKKFYA